jgi:hypothetical protein
MPSLTRARLSAVGAIAVMAACVAALTCFFWQVHALLFEVGTLAAFFVAFRAALPVARWLAGLPTIHRAIFYALLAAVVAGHFAANVTGGKRIGYPFIAWDIFSNVSETETVSCRELIGTTADGKTVRLLVEQLFPSIIQFDLPLPDEPEKMARLVTALARAYNARHAADPVREVDLMLMAVKLHPPPGQSNRQPSCKFLQRYDISSAPAS